MLGCVLHTSDLDCPKAVDEFEKVLDKLTKHIRLL